MNELKARPILKSEKSKKKPHSRKSTLKSGKVCLPTNVEIYEATNICMEGPYGGEFLGQYIPILEGLRNFFM